MINQTNFPEGTGRIPHGLTATADRLRESKKKFLAETAATYDAYGEVWARKTATYEQLRHLSDCANDTWGGVPELTVGGVYHLYSDDWDEDTSDEKHMDFWDSVGGSPREYFAQDTCEAFARGALRSWNQVSGLI